MYKSKVKEIDDCIAEVESELNVKLTTKAISKLF